MSESATTAIRNALSVPSRPFAPDDEVLHPPNTDDPMWAESSWWVFTAPDHDLMGWVYLLFRRNLGVASVGVWIWDGTGSEPRDLLYSKHMVHVPIGEATDLRRLRFDAPFPQVEVDILEDLRRYRLAYRDGDELSVELELTGVCAPVGLGISEELGHCDQPLWAVGSIVLPDRNIAVDAAAFRDRTWSSRPELPTASANCYTWGTSKDLAFQHLSMLGDDGQPFFTGGLLHRDGQSASVAKIERTVVARRSDGCPERIDLHVTDELGRTLLAQGTCGAGAALPGFAGFLTWATLVRWEVDGEVIWGEDHDSWSHGEWRQRRLANDPRVH